MHTVNTKVGTDGVYLRGCAVVWGVSLHVYCPRLEPSEVASKTLNGQRRPAPTRLLSRRKSPE